MWFTWKSCFDLRRFNIKFCLFISIINFKGENLAATFGILFFETSAKTGQNIEEIF